MNNKFQIASLLIAYRYVKDQSQTDVSKILNVSTQQIQKYEKMKNEISAINLLNFCNFYQINLDNFQYGDCYQVLDGADISLAKKEKALNIIEKLYYEKIEPKLNQHIEVSNDKS